MKLYSDYADFKRLVELGEPLEIDEATYVDYRDRPDEEGIHYDYPIIMADGTQRNCDFVDIVGQGPYIGFWREGDRFFCQLIKDRLIPFADDMDSYLPPPWVDVTDPKWQPFEPLFTPPPSQNDLESDLIRSVRTAGWHVVHVLGEETAPPYSYTVGLFYTYRHPEIVTIGLPAATAQRLLESMHAKIREGHVFQPNTRTTELTEGLELAFVNVVRDTQRFLPYADWYYTNLAGPFPALQVIWPDRANRFPWDEEFEAHLREAQPLLGDFASETRPTPPPDTRDDDVPANR